MRRCDADDHISYVVAGQPCREGFTPYQGRKTKGLGEYFQNQTELYAKPGFLEMYEERTANGWAAPRSTTSSGQTYQQNQTNSAGQNQAYVQNSATSRQNAQPANMAKFCGAWHKFGGGWGIHPNDDDEACRVVGMSTLNAAPSNYSGGQFRGYEDLKTLKCGNGGWFAFARGTKYIADVGFACGGHSREQVEQKAMEVCESTTARQCQLYFSALNEGKNCFGAPIAFVPNGMMPQFAVGTNPNVFENGRRTTPAECQR